MNNKIGILDSGVGGIAIAQLIQDNSFIPIEYYADNANMPWGNKSVDFIQQQIIKICNYFIKKNCNNIVIACVSGSCVVKDILNHYFKQPINFFDIVTPTVEYIKNNYSNCKLGLIATEMTINSQVLQKNIEDQANNVIVEPLATPLLAPLIEKGKHSSPYFFEILGNYLCSLSSDIDGLILGCTHYAYITEMISTLWNNLDILDVSKIVTSTILRSVKFEKLNNYKVFNYCMSDPSQEYLNQLLSELSPKLVAIS